jgi:hypothetical protein
VFYKIILANQIEKKMKTLLVLFIFYAHQFLGQEIPTNIKGQAEWVDFSFVDSASKEILYARAMAWLQDTYGNVKKAEQIKTNSEWTIVAKTTTEKYRYHFKGKDMKIGHFSYIISIHCKDTKYKCIINEIQYDSNVFADLLGTDLSATQPFSPKYEADGFVQIWKFLQLTVSKDLKKDLATLKIYMLNELPK